MNSDSLVLIGIVVASVILIIALIAIVYFIFRTSYLLPERDQAYIRTGFGGEKIAHGKGVFVLPGLHKKLLLDMKTHKITVERKEEHACITSDRLRIDITADFLVRISPEDSKISLAGQTLGDAAFNEKKLIEQIQGTCVESLRDATAKMSFEALHADNQRFNDLVENALAEDLAMWGLQLEAISIATLKQTDLKFFDDNNALDVEGITSIKEKIAENQKKQSLIEAERVKEVERNQLDAHKEVLRLQEEKAKAQQDQDLAIAETQLSTERLIEQARANEQIAIAEANAKVSEAWIEAHKMKALEVAKKEEIQTSISTTKAHRNKQVRIIDADLQASRTRILAEAEKDAEVLRVKGVSARYTVDAEGKKALNKAANILSDKQISMQVKQKIVSKLPDIIKESVKPIKNIDGIKIMQIDGMSHLTGGMGGGGNGGGNGSSGDNSGGGYNGGGSLGDQIVNSALRYKAQAPMVENLLKHVGLAGGGINDLTADLQKDMNLDTPLQSKPKEIESKKKSEKHSYAEGKPVGNDSINEQSQNDVYSVAEKNDTYHNNEMDKEDQKESSLSENTPENASKNASENNDQHDKNEEIKNNDSEQPQQTSETETASKDKKPTDKPDS